MYHDAITERSWATLLELRQRYQFVLIGGWAAWVYTHGAKSRDIDIVVNYEELGRLRVDHAVLKNDRLKKYEIKADGFDIDIYVPHYSSTLAVSPEYLLEHPRSREGFQVPALEVLLALKLGAWKERKGTLKGEKDLLDIRALLPLTTRAQFAATLDEAGSEVRLPDALALFDEISKELKRQRYSGRGRASGPER